MRIGHLIITAARRHSPADGSLPLAAGAHSPEEIRQRKRVFDQMHSADSEYRRIRNLAAAAVLAHNVRDPHPMRATVHPT
jgi:hypothetical protein